MKGKNMPLTTLLSTGHTKALPPAEKLNPSVADRPKGLLPWAEWTEAQRVSFYFRRKRRKATL
jgi:hypothetical protein